MKISKNKKLMIIVVMALIAVIGAANLGNFLIVNDKLYKADAIVVFSGDNGPRTEKGVELLKEGLGE